MKLRRCPLLAVLPRPCVAGVRSMACSAGAIAPGQPRQAPTERRSAEGEHRPKSRSPSSIPNATRAVARTRGRPRRAARRLQKIVEAVRGARTTPKRIAKADAIARQRPTMPTSTAFAARSPATPRPTPATTPRRWPTSSRRSTPTASTTTATTSRCTTWRSTQYEAKQYAEALTDARAASTSRDQEPTRRNTRRCAQAASLLAKPWSALRRKPRQLYEQMLAQRNPADKKALMNAVAAYQQADQFDKADAPAGEAQGKGQLTDARRIPRALCRLHQLTTRTRRRSR